jgi:hypothetical protein
MTTERFKASVLALIPPAPTELSLKQIYDRSNQTFTPKTLRGVLLDLRADGFVAKGGTDDQPTYRRVL